MKRVDPYGVRQGFMDSLIGVPVPPRQLYGLIEILEDLLDELQALRAVEHAARAAAPFLNPGTTFGDVEEAREDLRHALAALPPLAQEDRRG